MPPDSRVNGRAWSPNGTRFAFTATDRNGVGEIYTVRTDGSGLFQVTKNVDVVDNVAYESTISWR